MKKVISIIMCVIMLLVIVPVGAFAYTYPLGSMYNPIQVAFGQKYNAGWDGDNDYLNYYTSFKTTQKGLVTFEFTKPFDSQGEMGEIELSLYDSEGNCIWYHESRNEKDDPKPTTTYTVGLNAGEYLLNVTPGFTVTSGYIAFQHTYNFEATKYCEAEPSNTIPDATPLNLGYFYKGTFGTTAYYVEGADEFDFFKFYVTKGVKYRVRFKDVKKLAASTTILDVIMNGADVSGFYGLTNIENRYDNEGYAYTDFIAPDTGYAYLKFHNYNGTPLKYEVEISKVPVICSNPQLESVKSTQSGIKITWGKVTGADSYRVYRKVSGGSWEYLDSTKKTSFTDKTAKSGTKYYYAVRAKNAAGLSSRSNVFSKYYLADPVMKTPTSTTSGIKLSWSKSVGAEGYIIYRKTGSGSYSRLKVEKGVSNLSYTDSSAKKGKKYTYKLKAYKSKTYSAYSATKTITDKY